MNFKKILFSSILMVIGLQASENDPKRELLEIIFSPNSPNLDWPFNQANRLYTFLKNNPSRPIDVFFDDESMLDFLLQKSANPENPEKVVQEAMNTFIRWMENPYNCLSEKSNMRFLKFFLKHGGKTELYPYKIGSQTPMKEINRAKKEIEEEKNETRAFEAFMTEAGLGRKKSLVNVVEIRNMLGIQQN